MYHSQICRISASRGKAIAPHFSGTRNGDEVFISEFITYPSNNSATSDSAQLHRDLESAAINLIYGGSKVLSVFIPLILDPWEMADVKISSTKDGLVFRKI